MKNIFIKIIITGFVLSFSTTAYGATYYINALFKTEDLIAIDAQSKIGKTGWDDEFAIFHQITGDLEIGYLTEIQESDNGYSICTFKYEEDKYRKDVDVFSINSWVESLDSKHKLIRSLPNAKIFAIEN